MKRSWFLLWFKSFLLIIYIIQVKYFEKECLDFKPAQILDQLEIKLHLTNTHTKIRQLDMESMKRITSQKKKKKQEKFWVGDFKMKRNGPSSALSWTVVNLEKFPWYQCWGFSFITKAEGLCVHNSIKQYVCYSCPLFWN